MSAMLQSAKSAAGWILVPFRELGTWTGGGTPSKSKPEFWINGTIPWVSPKDMKTNRITGSQDQITKAAIEGSAAKLIPAQSVLVVTRSGILSHTLPVAVTTLPVAVNQDLKAVTPNQVVLPEYIACALRCFAREILNTCSKQGTTVSSIETKALQAFEIPVAPLEEQREIVAEIEKQFSRLDKAETNLHCVKANLKRYKAAVLKAAVEGRLVETEAELARREGRIYEPGEQLLQRILETRRGQWKGKGKYKEPAAPDTTGLPELPEGWVWASVDQLVAHLTDGDHQAPPQTDKGIPFLVIGNVRNGEIDFAGTRYVGETYYESLAPYRKPRLGDILYTLVGSYGIPVRVKTNVPFCVQRHMAILRPHENSPFDYLTLAMASDRVFKQATTVATGTAQKTVPLAGLRKIAIPLPPLAEQLRIVADVERHISLMLKVQEQVRILTERSGCLRASVLSHAFGGKRSLNLSDL